MFCSDCGTPNRDEARFCHACGHTLTRPSLLATEGAQPTVAEAVVTTKAAVVYATFGQRAHAFLIDSLILTGAGIVIVLLLVVAMQSASESDVDAISRLVGLLGAWLYYALLESSERQATIGKQKAGIRITDLNGQRISFGRASGRFFGKLLSAIPFGVGFLFIGFTRRKQTLHDLMAGCVVVRDQ